MRISNLERLFAKAREAEAARLAAEERRQANRTREIQRDRLRQLEADARAPAAAERVWHWLNGVDAERLGDLLRASGLREVLLIPWMTSEGQRARGIGIGAWSVAFPGRRAALSVRRIAYPPGGRSRLAHSPTGLLNTSPTRVVVALDRALGSGRYLGTVRDSLREAIGPDA